jgi:hypothetical protein
MSADIDKVVAMLGLDWHNLIKTDAAIMQNWLKNLKLLVTPGLPI